MKQNYTASNLEVNVFSTVLPCTLWLKCGMFSVEDRFHELALIGSPFCVFVCVVVSSHV